MRNQAMFEALVVLATLRAWTAKLDALVTDGEREASSTRTLLAEANRVANRLTDLSVDTSLPRLLLARSRLALDAYHRLKADF